MSHKSAAHPAVHGHTLFSRKTILIAVLFVAAMFFVTITYYPLIFNSQNNVDQPMPPRTPIK